MPFCYQRQDKGLSLWPYESAKATRWDLQSSDPTTLHWFYLPAMHPQAIKHDEMTVFRVHLVLSHGLVLSSLRFQQDMFSPAWVAFEQTRWSFNYACSCSMGSGQGLHNDKVCPQHSEINSKLDYATNWVQLLCFSLKPRAKQLSTDQVKHELLTHSQKTLNCATNEPTSATSDGQGLRA